MIAEGQFRLGDMLSLTLHAPLSLRWPVTEDRALKLVLYMTEGYFFGVSIGDVVKVCARELCRQLPWLTMIKMPAAVLDSRDWAMVWAWLDLMERRYGEWHPVRKLSELPSGASLDFADLPDEVQDRLRQLGFLPKS